MNIESSKDKIARKMMDLVQQQFITVLQQHLLEIKEPKNRKKARRKFKMCCELLSLKNGRGNARSLLKTLSLAQVVH